MNFREHGQGTADELRNRDFRKELEEREREHNERDGSSRDRLVRKAIEASKETAAAAKRPRSDQVSAASLDADDPLDDSDSDSDSDDDDEGPSLEQELQKIRKERAMEQAKQVNIDKRSI